LLFATLLKSWGSCQNRTALGTEHTFHRELACFLFHSQPSMPSSVCIYPMCLEFQVELLTMCHEFWDACRGTVELRMQTLFHV
jgi:hypothetical protein